MQLTFVTDLGQSFVVDIDADMELENVMALLEAEVQSRCPTERFHTDSSQVGDSNRRAKYLSQWSGIVEPKGYHGRVWCWGSRDAPVTAQGCRCRQVCTKLLVLSQHLPT